MAAVVPGITSRHNNTGWNREMYVLITLSLRNVLPNPSPTLTQRLASRLIELSHMFITEPNISKENEIDISGNEATHRAWFGLCKPI